MSKKWPTVRLGDVLTAISRAEVVDPVKEYRLLGLRLNGQGPFLRETVTGSQSSATRLFRVSKGDFIYSRLFASRGAFGVIDEELDGCYVSGEFPTFTPITDRVAVEFLRYWFWLPAVIARVNEYCSGSTPLTRNRLREQFFVDLEVPLPPLAEQRRVVARIEELASELHDARNIRGKVDADLDALLLSSYRRIADAVPRKPMSEVAPLNRRPVSVDPEKIYPQVAVRSFGRGAFHKPPLVGREVTWQKPFLVKSGDILISNIKAWEGAIAVARPEDDEVTSRGVEIGEGGVPFGSAKNRAGRGSARERRHRPWSRRAPSV